MLRIAQGQVGDVIEAELEDQAGEPLSIDGAAELVLIARPPHGPAREWAAVPVEDPDATVIGHELEAGDLDAVGRWLIQPRALLVTGEARGLPFELEVFEALDELDAGLVPVLVYTHLGTPWVTHSGVPIETH